MVFEDYDQNYNYYLFNRLTHQTMNLYWSDPLYYLSIGWLSIPNGNEPQQQSVGQLEYPRELQPGYGATRHASSAGRLRSVQRLASVLTRETFVARGATDRCVRRCGMFQTPRLT